MGEGELDQARPDSGRKTAGLVDLTQHLRSLVQSIVECWGEYG